MSFVADILIALVSCFFVQLWTDLVYPQLVYVIQYGSNLQDLRDRVTTLRADKDRIDSLVNEAKDRGENVDPVVLGWLSKANGILQDADNWDTEIVNLSKKWWHVLRLDWCSRRRLSKYAKEMAHDIDVVKTEGNSFIDAISRPAHNLRIKGIPTSDFICLASSTAAIQRIMDEVKDSSKHIIGVSGKEGVGKTMLIIQVAKRAEEERLFDTVAIVNVSQYPNQNVIQNEIAEFFGSRIEVESEHLRQSRLSNILKQKEKILIILDDVHERLDLWKIGIPCGTDHEGCKIIVTSRYVQVCDDMETNTNVLVEELSEQDALVLFKKKAAIPDSHVLDRGVEELIKQLGGIPNSIIKAGRASRNKPPDQWIDAIREMRDSTLVMVPRLRRRRPSSFAKKVYLRSVELKRTASHEIYPRSVELQRTAIGRILHGLILEKIHSIIGVCCNWRVGRRAKGIMHHLMDKIRSIIGVNGHWRVGRRAKGIMHHLMDERNNIIGVYGHGRVDRTTLIKRLAEHAENQKLFNKVVTIPVPPTPDVKIIQDQIALLLGSEIEEEGEYLWRVRRLSEILKEHENLIIRPRERLKIIQDQIAVFLGSEIEEEGEYLRRARLSEILKKEHKVLIILDEVRERLDLGYIGIPYGNEHKGCKIIVSSPDVEVCNSMETDVSIGENKLWNQSEAIGCAIA